MSRQRTPALAALALLSLVTASCTLGPDYERPPVESPPGWIQGPEEQASIADIAWWELFEDEALRELIEIALAENRNLKIAVERIEEARARYGFSRGALWPAVDLTATGGQLRISEGSLTHTPEGISAENPLSIYNAGFSLSWEIDLFGRIRRANEAELATLLATEEARRGVAITLVSEVARAYVELRDFDSRLEITRRTLESRREYVDLASDRFEGGVTSEVDMRQAEAELHRVEALVHQTERLVAQKENELSALIGRAPSSIPRGLALEAQKIPPQVPAGLPAALLERRPDVREAEQRLVSANARIGEAKALLFPRISLTGSYGYASTDIDTFLESPSRSWNLLGNLLQPIFHAGQNKRRVEVTESRQRQALYDYEETILQALREVEDSLVGLRKTGEQRGSQTLRVAAERKVVELSELRYRGGVAAYLEVLDAQRSLFDAEIDEVRSTSEQYVSFVRLYRALGGGWPVAPAEVAAESGGEPSTAAQP